MSFLGGGAAACHTNENNRPTLSELGSKVSLTLRLTPFSLISRCKANPRILAKVLRSCKHLVTDKKNCRAAALLCSRL